MANMHQAGYGIEIPLELMTCLLRLRCQPPVPYPMIARILQEVHPAATVSYTPESAPWVTSPDPNKRLEAHLEQVYDNLEKRQSETWKAARGFDEAALKVLLRNTELDAKFGIMGIKELTLQIKWKKDGDWRAGSTPLRSLGDSRQGGNAQHFSQTDGPGLESIPEESVDSGVGQVLSEPVPARNRRLSVGAEGRTFSSG